MAALTRFWRKNQQKNNRMLVVRHFCAVTRHELGRALTCHYMFRSLHAAVQFLGEQGVPTVDRRSLVEVRQHVEWWDENTRVNVREGTTI